MFRILCSELCGPAAEQVFEDEYPALLWMFALRDMGYDTEGIEYSEDGKEFSAW